MQVHAGKFSLIQDPGRNKKAKGDGDDEVDLGDTCGGIFRELSMSIGRHFIAQDMSTFHPVKVLIWCTGRSILEAKSLISASSYKLQLIHHTRLDLIHTMSDCLQPPSERFALSTYDIYGCNVTGWALSFMMQRLQGSAAECI